MAVLSPLLAAAAWWKFGLRTALGFVFGCGIAYVNFYWLKRVIAGLSIAQPEPQRRNRDRELYFDFWFVMF